MKPIQLYIENFMSHEQSYINFTLFNSALIIGKTLNSELHSNGVGKTTIFKAIEFVLFNEIDFPLEKVVRDNCTTAKVIFDFQIDNYIYRVIRIRTKNNSKDFSLYRKQNDNIVIQDFDNKNWQNLTERRDTDTEKSLESIIKINFKSFQNTVHFIQRDISGLAVTSPEKRKQILKDALNLTIYAKLEKLAKDDLSNIEKNILIKNTTLESIGNPEEHISECNNKLSIIIPEIQIQEDEIKYLNDFHNKLEEHKNNIKNKLTSIKNEFNSILNKKNTITNDINKQETQLINSQPKLKQLIEQAKITIEEVKNQKEQIELLKKSNLDTSQLDEESKLITQSLFDLTTEIKSIEIKIKELQQPLPKEQKCKYCRNILTPEYLDKCKHDISTEIKQLQDLIKNKIQQQDSLNKNLTETKNKINDIKKIKEQISKLEVDTNYKEKEVNTKRAHYTEIKNNIKTLESTISEKKKELELITIEINNYDQKEIDKLTTEYNNQIEKINTLKTEIQNKNNKILANKTQQGILNHKITEAKENINKKQNIIKELEQIQKQASIIPEVIQAFSSTGIPNLIIQNILDDLQSICNDLLNQLKPGMQLCFYVEKTTVKGNKADTLDIGYFVNNKPRDFLQLSGAQRLAVSFALKLGLSLILHKLMGVDIKFLLLDEVDDSLDKASIDTFADMVKTLENNYLILIITHNDRLKEKFSNIITVSQNIDGASSACYN